VVGWWKGKIASVRIMSPELIAILVTALLQIVGLVIIARMERENARMLEHIDGGDAAIFL
jgi:hypothetical protein